MVQVITVPSITCSPANVDVPLKSFVIVKPQLSVVVTGSNSVPITV